MRDKYIQGIYNEYAGRLDQSIADLMTLLESPVGVGEHGSVSEEIKRKINEVDRYQSLVDTIKNLFSKSSEEVSNEGNPN
tara:strand:- start:887 stop:1126 length:240 start_codon:yes stop_codon:yes gene_type:complete